MSPPQTSRRPLLVSAVALFAERGYAGAAESQLLQATALDEVAFRRRFADKEGCFLAAYDSVIAIAHGRLVASLDKKASWPARLAAALRCLLELIDANPAAARLVLIESQFAGEAALRRYMATLKNLAPFMCGGRRCATTAEYPPPILDSVLPAGAAITVRHQLLRGAPAHDLYPDLLGCLLLPYLGEAEAAPYLVASTSPRFALGRSDAANEPAARRRR